MTLQTIESKDVSLGDLFVKFFVVPNFQREYVWQTGEVRQLLEDVYAEYSDSDRNKDSEYFIGTIVTCVGDDAVQRALATLARTVWDMPRPKARSATAN
jgi:uncharacterized protein with ParB-like and HNH nuclease domain